MKRFIAWNWRVTAPVWQLVIDTWDIHKPSIGSAVSFDCAEFDEVHACARSTAIAAGRTIAATGFKSRVFMSRLSTRIELCFAGDSASARDEFAASEP